MNRTALTAPIALTPSKQFAVKLGEARAQHPYLLDLPPLVAALNRLTAAGGVPVTLDNPKPDGTSSMRLYVGRCMLGLYPTRRGDAYYASFVQPMTLDNHARLARRRLTLAPPRWIYAPTLQQVPPGCSAHIEQIRQAWQRLDRRTDAPVQRRPAHHDMLCDDLDTVIEASRQIEAARRQAQATLPYSMISSAGEERRSIGGIYVFHLARPGPVKVGDLIESRQVPDLKGRVRKLDGDRLTVQFDRAVDRPRLPEQGELVLGGSDVVQRVQREAVGRLRYGTAVNPALLPLLADAAFAAWPGPSPDGSSTPIGPLDDGQRAAFHGALSVPDMLLVQGPPGTGKTRTIVETAAAAAARGERVLVASQTNTAVDNALSHLPASLIGLRVGNDARISNEVRHLTLPVVAEGVQRQILERTEAAAARLSPWLAQPSIADAWAVRIDAALDQHTKAIGQRDACHRARQTAVHAVEALHVPALASAQADERAAQDGSTEAEQRRRRIQHRYQLAERRSTGAWSFVYRWWAQHLQAKAAAATSAAETANDRLDRAQRIVSDLAARTRQAVEADPTVRRVAAQLAAADVDVAQTRTAARAAMAPLLQALVGVADMEEPVDTEALFRCRDRYRQLAPVLRQRAALLREWREQLGGDPEQLHAEIVRYAQVVGATCIGTGVQQNRLTDLVFDLVIIDEAGQIPTAATLVPLVRGRRFVLVGDHRQLPPFVDDDVREWIERRDPTASNVDQARLVPLLTRSAFEQLVERAPEQNRILLNCQRRMPAVLGDFVSQQFYDGLLSTGTVGRRPVLPFLSALAVIDTSDLRPQQRAERRRDGTETWQATGCDNPVEASIVVDLVQWAARNGQDWAVIAPYAAQVQMLTVRLRSMLGDEAIASRVGTVDAFQGREHDLVVYSFTRSNQAGNVGFLRELRRLNVAITRSRVQLVLVGDCTTLRKARDAGFRQLMDRLYAYAQQYGDIRPSAGLRDLLS
jgi:hypothetical protein